MTKVQKNSRKEQYLANRKALIERSNIIRLAVKEGVYDSVNEGLREMYMESEPEIEEFNTFNQWKEQGYTIVKGSKAHLFWGQPRTASQVPDGSEEPEEYKYWPLCYLFSNIQVFKKEEQSQEPKQPTKREPQTIENLDEVLA